MVKILFSLISLSLITVSLTAQLMDTVYYNSKKKEISAEKFHELEYVAHYLPASYTDGNQYINYLIFINDQNVLGQLKTEEYNKLKKHLSYNSGLVIDDQDIIVIKYYPGTDRFNKYRNTGQLRKTQSALKHKLKQVGQVKTFFFSKLGAELENYNKTANWIPDRDQYLENQFFPHHYLGTSLLVVLPNGQFMKQLGHQEYDFAIRQIQRFVLSAGTGSRNVTR